MCEKSLAISARAKPAVFTTGIERRGLADGKETCAKLFTVGLRTSDKASACTESTSATRHSLCQVQGSVDCKVLANFRAIYRSHEWTLTCQSRFVLREHQEALVHLLGAWRKDARRNVLWVGAKYLRGSRLSACLSGDCWVDRLRIDLRLVRRAREDCGRDRSRASVDDLAVINFDGVDRIYDDLFARFASDFLFVVGRFDDNDFRDTFAGLCVNFFRLQITDSKHNVVSLEHLVVRSVCFTSFHWSRLDFRQFLLRFELSTRQNFMFVLYSTGSSQIFFVSFRSEFLFSCEKNSNENFRVLHCLSLFCWSPKEFLAEKFLKYCCVSFSLLFSQR